MNSESFTVEELEARIQEANLKLEKLRNSVERAELVDTIKVLQTQVSEMKLASETKVIQNKDVPSRLDHESGRAISRGEVINANSSSVVTI